MIAAASPPSRTLSWLSLFGFVLRNWFVSWTFFLPSFVLNLVGILGAAVLFYLSGEAVQQGVAAELAGTGLSYGGYLITGVMLNLLLATSLTAYHKACLRGYWNMEFDVYLQHPGGVWALLAGEVAAGYILALINTAVYLVVGVSWFDIPMAPGNLPGVALIVVLGILAVSGLGLAGASTFALLDAKREGPNPVELVVGFLATLVAGVYFPPSVLPAWLERVGEALPHTHALRAARLCLTGEAALADPRILAELRFLLLFAAVSLPVGISLFALGMRKAQREGSLTRWS